MARKQRPERWVPEPGAAATGGHVPPDVSAGAPLDAVTAPLTEDLERAEREAQRERARRAFGASVQQSDTATTPTSSATAPLPQQRTPRRIRPSIRRVKRTVKHVNPRSVLKLSLFFYACFLVVWLVVVALIYFFVESTGFFTDFREVQELLDVFEDVDLRFATIEKWALYIGIVLAIVGSLVNTFLAVLYNVASDIIGGLELTFVERDQ